jgi:hypothetical protein
MIIFIIVQFYYCSCRSSFNTENPNYYKHIHDEKRFEMNIKDLKYEGRWFIQMLDWNLQLHSNVLQMN